MSLNQMFDEFNSLYRVKGTDINKESAKGFVTLVCDEVVEFAEEFDKETLDKAAAAKEGLDAIYAGMQQLRTMGIDLEAGLKALHSSNMSKTVKRADAKKELEIARERYPQAYIDEAQAYCVIRDAATGKVIKPTTYTPAIVNEDIYSA